MCLFYACLNIPACLLTRARVCVCVCVCAVMSVLALSGGVFHLRDDVYALLFVCVYDCAIELVSWCSCVTACPHVCNSDERASVFDFSYVCVADCMCVLECICAC